MHGAFRPRLQCDALETLQLPDGARGTACALVDVKLDHSVASATAGVGDIDRSIDRFSDACGWSYFQIVDGKRGVTQAVSERIQRCAGKVPVARLEVGRGLRILREVVVVVKG